MTKSSLDEAVDLAWQTLDRIVTGAVGEPKQRAVSKLVEVHKVPDSSRVVVTDVKSVGQESGGVAEYTYTGTPVYLFHRRHKLPLTENDLRFLHTEMTEGTDTRKMVKNWAETVISAETRRLTTRLLASPAVSDVLNTDSVLAAKGILWPDDSALLTPATLLVTRNGLDDPQERRNVRRALAGGPIIDLPMTRTCLGSTALLVDPSALKAVSLVAIDLKLGWNPVNGEAVIHLDHRTSTPAETPAVCCVPISPAPSNSTPPTSAAG